MRLSKRRRKVLMHLTSGLSLEGVLMGRSHGHYVLRAAVLLKDDEQSFSIDGEETAVPVEKVAFYTVVTG